MNQEIETFDQALRQADASAHGPMPAGFYLTRAKGRGMLSSGY
jgi:hypothetical protein